jgi:hypothetical protein
VSDDQGTHGQPDGIRQGLSRRHFIYGTTAAAAGAVVFGGPGGPLAHAAVRAAPARHPGRVIRAQGTGTFSCVQVGPQAHGTGSVALEFNTNEPSTEGTLLVASLLSTDGTPAGAFAGPAGWRRATAVPAGGSPPAGRVEIWFYAGTPAAPGNPGGLGVPPNPPANGTPQTFTSSSAAACRGCMAEFQLPANTVMTVFDAVGQNSGTGGTSKAALGLTAAAANVAGDLGIAAAGDFFSTQTSGNWSWTAPAGAGWTLQRAENGVTDNFGAWYNTGLTGTEVSAAGTAQVLGAEYSAGGGQWGFAFAAFRAVTFQPIYLSGGEMITMAALDPTGQQLVLGGDVEGQYRSSDLGLSWQVSQNGLYGQGYRYNACVAWSLLETGVVYACTGSTAKASSIPGGFVASTDGGLTWALRSPTPQYEAGDVPDTLLDGDPGDTNRSVGRLLVQDTSGGNLYTATFNGGIYASPKPSYGGSWNEAGLNQNPNSASNSNPYFARALVMNPANNQELWAGLWEYTDTSVTPPVTYGGIYHCTDMSPTAGGTWSQVTSVPSGLLTETVSDLLVIGDYLYAVYAHDGVYVTQINSNTWTLLNPSPINLSNGQIWTSIDGYVSPGNPDQHVLVVGCSSGDNAASGKIFQNVVRITVNYPASGGAPSSTSAVDLTVQYGVYTTSMPPYGQDWWLTYSGNANPNYENYLGGNAFANPHILINPNDTSTIFVAGSGGFFYTALGSSGQQAAWQIADTGVPISTASVIAVDPVTSTHVVIGSADHTHTDLTDPTGFSTADVTAVNTPDDPGTGKQINGIENRAIAFDSSSRVFTCFNTKFGQNTGGMVEWRAGQINPSESATWYDTGYSNALVPGSYPGNTTAAAPIGIYVGVDNTGATFMIVVSAGDDVWRAVPASGGIKQPWTWTQDSTGIGDGNVGLHCPIVADAEPGVLYIFDRANGIYRSTSYGATGSWEPIWPINQGSIQPLQVKDPRSGWLAASPATAGELWVTASNGVFQLTGATSGAVKTKSGEPAGITVSNLTGTTFPYGAAGIAITGSGSSEKVYTLAISGPSAPSVQLYAYPVGGPWTLADAGSIASYVSWPTGVAVATNAAGDEILLIASDSNMAVYGTPSA